MHHQCPTNDEGMSNDEARMKKTACIRRTHSAFGFRHFFVIGAALVAHSSFIIAAAAHGMATPADQLHALFAQDWQWRLRDRPEWATVLGDHRYGDRLTDLSAEAIAARREHAHEMLRRLTAIDRGQLAGQDLLSYDLFRFEQQLAVDAARFPLEVMMLDQLDGPQLALGQLVAFIPFRNADDYGKY